ncbi:hypothetical protein [Streptomyces griseorubiginosus]|uniref:hypothetical protein n=1 Tax=Streptomyces griseorubiginosus TaxID=67304 RepID=UPI00076CB44A|nr:hypothetical protein [Streptomyces griseorubiginosus]KUM69259.1 hypothetical protein AQI84_34600 [Streptomyces griseorubiginosus]
MTRTTKTIKAELRAERGKEHPDEGRLSELMAELRRARGGRPRLRRERGVDDGENSMERSARPGQDPDAEAIKTWPAALRARLGRSAYSRAIDGRPVEDPGGHGQRNDLRRWAPWG